MFIIISFTPILEQLNYLKESNMIMMFFLIKEWILLPVSLFSH